MCALAYRVPLMSSFHLWYLAYHVEVVMLPYVNVGKLIMGRLSTGNVIAIQLATIIVGCSQDAAKGKIRGCSTLLRTEERKASSAQNRRSRVTGASEDIEL